MMELQVVINLLLILIVLVIIFILVVKKVTKGQKRHLGKKGKLDKGDYTLDKLQEYVADSINNYLSINLLDLGLSFEEYERRKSNMAELDNALKNANSGDIREKEYVKRHIRDLITEGYGVDESTIDFIIPFNKPDHMTPQDQFESVLLLYKRKYGNKALEKMISLNGLDVIKQVIEGGTARSYIITADEIYDLYMREAHRKLSLDDKVDVIVQRLYQEYKGHGPIDEIRDMHIDGVSVGVSGLPERIDTLDGELEMLKSLEKVKKGSLNSIWIFYKGKKIHLSFLSFKSEFEIKRIAQTISKHNSTRQLTESQPYTVTDMKDGSRIVVVRPPLAETWAFWVRKFDLPNMDLEKLIPDELAENAELPREMFKHLMRGERTTFITGPTGAGKTSLLMAGIKYIPAYYSLRIHEAVFELNLRNLYPDRDTIAFRETETVSGEEALDLSRKTDTTVSILGELSSDEVAAWAIKTGTVASKFTLCTAHSNEFPDLISFMTNALYNTKKTSDIRKAEDEVARIIDFDVHVENDFDTRFIERITECVYQKPEVDMDKIDEIKELSQKEGMESKVEALIAIQLENLRKDTMRSWSARNIIEYENGKYVAKHPPSKEKVQKMLKVMTPEHAAEFKAFLAKHWGNVSYD